MTTIKWPGSANWESVDGWRYLMRLWLPALRYPSSIWLEVER